MLYQGCSQVMPIANANKQASDGGKFVLTCPQLHSMGRVVLPYVTQMRDKPCVATFQEERCRHYPKDARQPRKPSTPHDYAAWLLSCQPSPPFLLTIDHTSYSSNADDDNHPPEAHHTSMQIVAKYNRVMQNGSAAERLSTALRFSTQVVSLLQNAYR